MGILKKAFEAAKRSLSAKRQQVQEEKGVWAVLEDDSCWSTPLIHSGDSLEEATAMVEEVEEWKNSLAEEARKRFVHEMACRVFDEMENDYIRRMYSRHGVEVTSLNIPDEWL